jgi:malonyl-CoA O-methyltransferase
MKDKRAIAASFGEAAQSYDAVSEVQALAARRLAAAIPDDWARPRVLDVGVGTGHLAQALAARWPDADLTLSDIAPEMLAVAQGKLPGARSITADAESLPFADNSFDLVASNLALQWCDDLAGTLKNLARLLRPGGMLAVTTLLAGTWAEWRASHEVLGLSPAMLTLPDVEALRHALPWVGGITVETIVRPYRKGREFLRDINRLGAGPRQGDALSPHDLSQVLQRFQAQGPVASYEIATIQLRRPARAGVFVAGTDTGVGKTVVSVILAKAWGADYWKPVQTGLAADPGDSEFATARGIVTHPPRYEFQAPLSAYDAACRESRQIDIGDFVLPATKNLLVGEAAGGVASPLDEDHDMADLAAHLGLPVVLVARSGLGTINHTLLAIEHLRREKLILLGVVMVGRLNLANRAEIERRGNVQVLLQCPHFEPLTAADIARIASEVPSLARLGEKIFAAQCWFTNC